jgi:hypothetical protein
MSTPLFTSPEDAINACNSECERAWNQYIISQKLDITKAPQAAEAAEAAKGVFSAGYFAGARWVSDAVVKHMMSKQPTQPQQ